MVVVDSRLAEMEGRLDAKYGKFIAGCVVALRRPGRQLEKIRVRRLVRQIGPDYLHFVDVRTGEVVLDRLLEQVVSSKRVHPHGVPV